MNNFYFKSLLILISLFAMGTTFSQELDHNVEELLLKFENQCVQNKVSEIDKAQCDDLLILMNKALEENGIDKEEAAKIMEGVSPSCAKNVVEESSVEDIAELAVGMEDASLKMTCNEDDQEEVAASCHEDLMCNVGRSVMTAVDKVAPDFIASRVRQSMNHTASALGAGKKCIDSEGSDCLTEVVTSFVANIVGTLNTFKDVAVAAAKSIWGLKDYLFKKSDDMHAAANSTKGEISKFIDSPGEYIVEKFMKAKNAIDGWIKKEVFCQKWEGTPHIGECTEPLESYSCLNCNDGMNAFCAGAGIFASEAFIAVSTAGTLTAANIAVKAGVRLGASVAAKAAARISAKVPALGRVAGETSGISRAATKTMKVSMATLQKMSAAVGKYKERLGNSVVTKDFISVAKRIRNAADTVTIPLRYFDDLAEGAMKGVLRRAAAKSGDDRLSHFIRASARYEKMKVAELLRRGENLSHHNRDLLATRIIRRAWGHTGDRGKLSSTGRGGSPTRSDHPIQRSEGYGHNRDTNRDQASLRSEESSSRGSGHKQEETTNEGGENSSPASSSRVLAKNSDSDIPGVVRATRYAMAYDLAAKVSRGLGEEDGIAPTELLNPMTASAIINSEGAQGSTDGLDRGQVDRSAIEKRTGKRFKSEREARDFARAMNNQYSDYSNRSKIINSFEKLGYSSNDARKLYEAEKDFYGQNFLTDKQGSISRAFNRIDDGKSKSVEKITQANTLVADIRKQIKDLEKQIDSESNIPQTGDVVNGNNSRVPSATPTATPSPVAQSSSSIGASRSPSSFSAGFGGVNNGGPAATDSEQVNGEGEITAERVETEINEDQIEEVVVAKESVVIDEESAEVAPEMGKVDYLDLYLKLAEVAALNEELAFSEVSSADALLLDGQIDTKEYVVLNINVKAKSYKIFRHKKSGSSIAFRVAADGLDFLEDFPKDLI